MLLKLEVYEKYMLASFLFSNGLGTSLPLSRVKNLVISNGLSRKYDPQIDPGDQIF